MKTMLLLPYGYCFVALSFLGVLLLATTTACVGQQQHVRRRNDFQGDEAHMNTDYGVDAHSPESDLSSGTSSQSQETIVLVSSYYTTNHAQKIQDALNRLMSANQHGSLLLIGHFVIMNTIYLPSHITWRLEGSLTLGTNATLDTLGQGSRTVGITEMPGGASNIHMSGGVYNGNKRNQYNAKIRFIKFVSVQNSVFRDMNIHNASDDNFSLGIDCLHNQVHNITSSHAGGNGLTDRGTYNKWFDCTAQYCQSDGWTPKSSRSEYHRCVARENSGPGFGLYARQDSQQQDTGATINGNKFYEIQAYCNKNSGMSLNIADNSGPGAEIINNVVQGIFYQNGRSGVELRNRLADGKIVSNRMDLVAMDNYGYSPDGTLLGGISATVSGLAVTGQPLAIDSVTGFFLGSNNTLSNSTDINIAQATNSKLNVYQTQSSSPLVVVGNVEWQPPIDCSAQDDELDAELPWRVKAYCAMVAQPFECETKWIFA